MLISYDFDLLFVTVVLKIYSYNLVSVEATCLSFLYLFHSTLP